MRGSYADIGIYVKASGQLRSNVESKVEQRAARIGRRADVVVGERELAELVVPQGALSMPSGFGYR
jgi:hypothetical protein